jgi:hypothetical protein
MAPHLSEIVGCFGPEGWPKRSARLHAVARGELAVCVIFAASVNLECVSQSNDVDLCHKSLETLQGLNADCG